MPKVLQGYAEAHGRLARSLPGGELWRTRRAAALERLLQLGLPTQRDEAWKYAPLRLIEQRPFEPARGDELLDEARTRELDAAALIVPGARRLTFIDGRFQAALSDDPVTIDDLKLEMLPEALHGASEALLGRIPDASDRPEDWFALLNEAFLSEGIAIRVPEGSTPAPLQLQFLSRAQGRARQPRVVIEVAKGAHAQVIEQHVSPSGDMLTNGITNIRLEPGAVLEHYLLLDARAPQTP